MKILQKVKNNSRKILLLLSALVVGILLASSFSAALADTVGPTGNGGGGTTPTTTTTPPATTNCPTTSGGVQIVNCEKQKNYCGSGNDVVYTSIDIGCDHKLSNPIADMAFAIIRLLTDGVGIVVIASVIVGGIQYSTSRGDPQATQAAIGRIRASIMALFIFIFAYAILNYVIPAGFFQ
jgi:hypothetical protein